LIVEAFRHSIWNVILSVSLDLDPVCAMDKESLANLPDNIELNRYSSNLELLEHACLFIGQAGQGSTLEALFSGVPALLVPSAEYQNIVAERVVELGLGAWLPISKATPESLRSLAESLIADGATLARSKLVQKALRAENGAILAANLIEEKLQSSA
jgi:MGT family glycosyltransferase